MATKRSLRRFHARVRGVFPEDYWHVRVLQQNDLCEPVLIRDQECGGIKWAGIPSVFPNSSKGEELTTEVRSVLEIAGAMEEVIPLVAVRSPRSRWWLVFCPEVAYDDVAKRMQAGWRMREQGLGQL